MMKVTKWRISNERKERRTRKNNTRMLFFYDIY